MKILKSGLKGLSYYAFISIITIVLLIFVQKLWLCDLRVPMLYTGDVMGASVDIKNFILGGGIYNYPRLAMPYGLFSFDVFKGNMIYTIILRFMSLFTNQFGLILNVFYLATYPIIAMSCSFVLRKLKVNYIISLVCGILYSFCPYHFMRNEGHLYLSSYFLVPFICLILIWVMQDQLLNQKDINKESKSISKGILIFTNRKMLFAIVICCLIASSDIYYSAFTCFCLVFAGLYIFIETKRIRHAFLVLILISFIGLFIFINDIPTILYYMHNNIMKVVFARNYQEIEIYGLKISQLLLPISGHRIKYLADLRELYNNNFPLINENNTATLGFIMSIGFIYSIFTVIFKKTRKIDFTIEKLGKINLFILLLATVGGISSIVALIATTSIRCYNRFSIFIAMFSIMTIALLLQEAFNRFKKSKQQLFLYIIVIVLLIAGVFDQTTNSYILPYATTKKEFISDDLFVKAIEKTVDNNDMIFEFPILSKAIGAPVNKLGVYELYRPYLHSTKTRWSYGDSPGGNSDIWQQSLTTLPLGGIIDNITKTGFKGLYIDSFAYTSEDFTKLIKSIQLELNQVPLKSENSRLYYFDLSNNKAK